MIGGWSVGLSAPDTHVVLLPGILSPVVWDHVTHAESRDPCRCLKTATLIHVCRRCVACRRDLPPASHNSRNYRLLRRHRFDSFSSPTFSRCSCSTSPCRPGPLTCPRVFHLDVCPTIQSQPQHWRHSIVCCLFNKTRPATLLTSLYCVTFAPHPDIRLAPIAAFRHHLHATIFGISLPSNLTCQVSTNDTCWTMTKMSHRWYMTHRWLIVMTMTLTCQVCADERRLRWVSRCEKTTTPHVGMIQTHVLTTLRTGSRLHVYS